MRQDIVELIWLIMAPGGGANQKRMLWETMGGFGAVWKASRRDLMLSGAATEKLVNSLCDASLRTAAERQAWLAERSGMGITVLDEPGYPVNLKKIYDPPLALFHRGTLPRDAPGWIAVVGSRKATSYGRKVAADLASDLCSAGICVVSGAARGIDTCAHLGALGAGGSTVAVLGCGLSVVYPPENRQMLEKIAEKGAVVTEFPDDTPPLAYNFPMRNRIISGLSDGVVIVEAGEKSGSLITVDYSLEQGREVFAVPGNITSVTSEGTNRLIKEGAHMLTSAADVINEVPSLREKLSFTDIPAGPRERRISGLGLTKEDMVVLNCISAEPGHLETICSVTGLTPQLVSASLLNLMLKGAAEEHPGKIFCAAGK